MGTTPVSGPRLSTSATSLVHGAGWGWPGPRSGSSRSIWRREVYPLLHSHAAAGCRPNSSARSWRAMHRWNRPPRCSSSVCLAWMPASGLASKPTIGTATEAHRRRRRLAPQRSWPNEHEKTMTMHRDRRTQAHRGTRRHAQGGACASWRAKSPQPGVREGEPLASKVMEVYDGWRQADKALDAYRAARKRAWIVTTSDRANPR